MSHGSRPRPTPAAPPAPGSPTYLRERRSCTRRIRPGDRIRQEDIAERFGASRLPVREALRMLEAEGLTEHEPNKGARVPRLSQHEVDVIYQMRERLEPLALTESMPQLTADEHDRLDDVQERIEADADVERFLDLDREFHLLTYSGCAIDQLNSMVTRLWNSTQHYRRTFVQIGGRSRMWVVNAEHRLMLDAVVRRDPIDAERYLAGPHPAHPDRARPPPGACSRRARDPADGQRHRGGPGRRDRDTPLLTVLRNELGLVGSRFGCGLGPVRRLLRARSDDAVGALLRHAAVVGRGPGRRHGRGAVRRRPAPRPAGDPRQAGRAVRLLRRRDRGPRRPRCSSATRSRTRVRVAEALDRNLCRCGVAAADRRRRCCVAAGGDRGDAMTADVPALRSDLAANPIAGARG